MDNITKENLTAIIVSQAEEITELKTELKDKTAGYYYALDKIIALEKELATATADENEPQ